MALLIIIILLLFVPIFILFLIQIHRRSTAAKSGGVHLPPGPRGLSLIGNLHQIDNSRLHQCLWKLSKEYGPDLVSLRLGFVPTLVLFPRLEKMAKEVMKTNDLQICSMPSLLGQQKLSYNGLDLAFAPYNDYYIEMRKLCVVNLFNPNRVQRFRPIQKDEISRMIEKISKSVVASTSVNLSELMMLLTSTILLVKLLLGRGTIEDEGIERTSSFRIIFPFTGWVDRLTGLRSRLEKNFKNYDTFYQELIDYLLDSNRLKSEQEDIINVSLQLRKERLFKINLTIDHLFIHVVWAMTYLMKNPKAMKKAQEEIRNLMGDKGFVEEDDVRTMSVVKETMRLQPAVPLLVPRETTEKCILDGYVIPTKTTVFDNPKEFDLDRFLGNYVDLKGKNFEPIPFGASRRIYPGMHMGISTVELALANLLYKFDWQMPDEMKKKEMNFVVQLGIIMHKKNALQLMAKNYI
ncbi:hypothetical protein ACOSP7_011079 [Xanthoceras sorbifolium]